jgi:thioredoxin-related protein
MTMEDKRHMHLFSPSPAYRVLAIALISMSLALQTALATEKPMGEFFGARSAEKPHWFKESFLEFEEDVAEAAAENRRVMLYFHQDGCPYCARLVEENFADPELQSYIVEHFDGITLNMWGDREVVSVGGQGFSEKTFAAALKVQYTPTLIFLDETGQVALRLNGYYPPADFRAALSYVARKLEKEMTFAEFRLASLGNTGGELLAEDFFLAQTDLRQVQLNDRRPLVVYFESADCSECETMHKRILADAPTRKLVQQASNVQFDIASRTPLTTPAGKQTTAAQWARDLGIAYTPSLVFFDAAGKEVMRIDAFLKTFHFQSVYAYVLERAYIDTPEFQRYISARADHIREAGFDTDIWGYESFHD